MGKEGREVGSAIAEGALQPADSGDDVAEAGVGAGVDEGEEVAWVLTVGGIAVGGRSAPVAAVVGGADVERESLAVEAVFDGLEELVGSAVAALGEVEASEVADGGVVDGTFGGGGGEFLEEGLCSGEVLLLKEGFSLFKLTLVGSVVVDVAHPQAVAPRAVAFEGEEEEEGAGEEEVDGEAEEGEESAGDDADEEGGGKAAVAEEALEGDGEELSAVEGVDRQQVDAGPEDIGTEHDEEEVCGEASAAKEEEESQVRGQGKEETGERAIGNDGELLPAFQLAAVVAGEAAKEGQFDRRPLTKSHRRQGVTVLVDEEGDDDDGNPEGNPHPEVAGVGGVEPAYQKGHQPEDRLDADRYRQPPLPECHDG